MNISKPMRDLMVVERFELPNTTAGGLLLVNVTETNTTQGRVLSRGEGAVDPKTGDIMEIDVAVGDVVLFHEGAGIKVSEYNEKPELFLLREEDILAIVV